MDRFGVQARDHTLGARGRGGKSFHHQRVMAGNDMRGRVGKSADGFKTSQHVADAVENRIRVGNVHVGVKVPLPVPVCAATAVVTLFTGAGTLLTVSELVLLKATPKAFVARN